MSTEPDPRATGSFATIPVRGTTYFRASAAVAVLIATISVYIVVTGVGYGIWDGTRPGPGFFPICVGGVMTLLSTIWAVQSFTERGAREDDSSIPDRRGALHILFSVGIVVAFIVLVDVIGFVISFAVCAFGLFWFVAARRWWVAVVLAIITAAAVNALFRLALNVPLPVSPIPLLAEWGI
ncbi:MAG: tripartite tricarboxylate transporter TctB family protein [Protaetiibacter sp.]